MRLFAQIVLFILYSGVAYAEGIWTSGGYQLSNVHTWQQNGRVVVGGRVTGGPVCNNVVIRIHTSSDRGDVVSLATSVKNYRGNGELFEIATRGRYRSGLWRIDSVDVSGDAVRYTPPAISHQSQPVISTSVPEYTEKTQSNLLIFQNSKLGKINNPSNVLFSSSRYASIIVRQKSNSKVALIKNIYPGNIEVIQLEKGSYTAKVIQGSASKDIFFVVKNENETICLD